MGTSISWISEQVAIKWTPSQVLRSWREANPFLEKGLKITLQGRKPEKAAGSWKDEKAKEKVRIFSFCYWGCFQTKTLAKQWSGCTHQHTVKLDAYVQQSPLHFVHGLHLGHRMEKGGPDINLRPKQWHLAGVLFPYTSNRGLLTSTECCSYNNGVRESVHENHLSWYQYVSVLTTCSPEFFTWVTW